MLKGWKWILVCHIWLICMWEYRLTHKKMNSKQFQGILPPGPTPPPLEVNSKIKLGNNPQNFWPPPVGKISQVLAVFFILKAPLSTSPIFRETVCFYLKNWKISSLILRNLSEIETYKKTTWKGPWKNCLARSPWCIFLTLDL